MKQSFRLKNLDSALLGRSHSQRAVSLSHRNSHAREDGRNSAARKVLTFILIGALLVVAIVLVKSKTATELWSSPLLYLYTIFVTTFQLSRLAAAMLYKKAEKKIVHKITNYPYYQPTVTIVIPCKNEEELIAQTVTQCLNADYSKERLQLIVVNDGSTDRTSEKLHALHSTLPQEDQNRFLLIDWKENRGKRQAMAEGFRRASGEIIVQIDSDSYIEPDTFRSIIYPFRDPMIGGVSVHTEPANSDKNLLTKMQAAYYFMSFRIMKAAEAMFFTVLCLSGSASVYRRSAVLPVLDSWVKEKFRGLPVTWGDDRSLTSWVLRRGYKTLYTDYARAQTFVPDTLSKLLKQQLRWKKSWIINAIFTSRFIYAKQPFFAIFYYFPLIAITALTPFVILYAILYSPLVKEILPIYYFLGISLVTSLVILYYRFVAPQNKYWPYLYLWGIFNTLLLSLLIIVAVFRLNDRGWGTR